MSYPSTATWAKVAKRAIAHRIKVIWRLIERMSIWRRALPTTSVPRKSHWTHSVSLWLAPYPTLGEWQQRPLYRLNWTLTSTENRFLIKYLFSLLLRYSGDFTDSFGHLQTTKLGLNNNGYIPYVDYSRDYTPPPSLTLNHVKPTHTSLSNHLIIGTSTAAPTITSASIVGITTGSITNGTYSLTRNRPLNRLNNGLPMNMASSIQNGMMNSEFEHFEQASNGFN